MAARNAKNQAQQRVLPEFDGQVVDRFKMAFSGSFELDPSDQEDNELIQKLTLGGDVQITLQCNVKGRPHDVTLDKARRVSLVIGGAKLEAYAYLPDSALQLRLAERPEPNPLGDGASVTPLRPEE